MYLHNFLLFSITWMILHLLLFGELTTGTRLRHEPVSLLNDDLGPYWEERNASYWLQQAQRQLIQRLERFRNARGIGDGPLDSRVAKNIILFLGDGLSMSTLTAARILKGQREGFSGEECQLAVEQFPFSGLSKTYCINKQTADSACSATAYLAGVKTSGGTVGQSGDGFNVEPITQWAQREGKVTGVVTTTRLTDASPAGTYAHVQNRAEELEIARQLVEDEPGRGMKVILGGGLGKFVSERRDDRDLLEQWLTDNPDGCFARNLEDLRDCRHGNGSLLGVFGDNHLDYHLAANKEQPRLSEMTAMAIERLSQHPKGYFAFIEGGRIDHGHHETRAGYALDEMLEFDAAIEMAINMTDPHDTLIVVTADHAHTLSLSGYARRGTSILGLDKTQTDVDGVPYSILNYAIGKWQSLNKEGKRENPAKTLSKTSYFPSYIHGRKGVHSGEDVAIFAQGPQSHLFSGVMEQNLLPHLMGYAACLGQGLTLCNETPD
ncbi:alkaline phosphatase, tissue-nonspecific isozyme [Drosophila willistoni]|nr:alkaline phosphatase, tissue-nonspecific isozyme [Drosophila willistoni]XP_023035304.1 alkaline phosphatase, tissue-nonspecific isozyme [Drosophila willistoni]